MPTMTAAVHDRYSQVRMLACHKVRTGAICRSLIIEVDAGALQKEECRSGHDAHLHDAPCAEGSASRSVGASSREPANVWLAISGSFCKPSLPFTGNPQVCQV